MTVLQCKKCSHFIELEGAVPRKLRCPRCGSAVDAASDAVQPSADTVEVGPGPLAGKYRRGKDAAVLEATLVGPPAGPSKKGDVFGNYKILDEISRGAMGVVYRAKQMNLNRVVALKLLIAGERAGQDQIERFYRETQAVAKLRHPNIIPIYDMGKMANQHYFTMEYVDGQSLEEIILKGGVSQKQALDVIRQVGRALSHAHERGIIHRDVKPANILVDKQFHVQVTDFGLAKEVRTGRNMTHSGVTVGTPHYMSPEQARGASRKVDHRSDIYSLGAVLYELLTGQPPFDGETPVEIVLKVIQDEPVAPRKLKPRVPKDLETVCMKALDKDPNRRYQTVDDFLDDIERFRADEPIEARPSTLIYSVRKKINKHRELSMAVSAAVIVLSIIFLFLGHTIRTERQKRKDLMREQHIETARRESELREKQKHEAAQQDKWRKVFGGPFEEFTMTRWMPSGGTWKPLDSYLIGRATGPASLQFVEPLCGSVKVKFYFMLDAPLTGYFGLAISCLEDAEQSGYKFLFMPGKLVLVKGDTPKKEIKLRLQANQQYELLVQRESDFVSLTLDGKEVLSYRDLAPLTGQEYSRLRFLLSGGKVSVAGLVIELETTPLKGSPLIMADRLFMEGDYESAIGVYRLVAKMPPDKELAAEALYKMGLTYAKLGSTTDALECFKRVSAHYEQSKHAAVARLQLGLTYLKLRDYRAFQRSLEKYGLEPFLHQVLEEAPSELVEAYAAQIELPDEKTGPDARIMRLREFIILSVFLPEDKRERKKLASAHVRLGTALSVEGKHEQAVKAYREVIASYSDQFEAALEARYQLGHIYMELDDYSAAAVNFEKWLKLYPLETFSRKVVRNAIRSDGRVVRVQMSKRGWDYIARYVQKLTRLQRSLATAYVELGRLPDAVALADSVIEKLQMGSEGRTVETYLLYRLDRLKKQERWAHFWKGCVLTMQRAYQKALECFDLAYGPSLEGQGAPRPTQRLTEAQRRAMLGQIERAFGLDEETVDHNTRVNIMRYVIHLKLGNSAEAFKYIAAAFADNPAFFGVETAGMSEIFTLEALPEQIPDAVSKNTQAYCYLAGTALFAAGRRDEARVFLAQAAGKKSWWPSYLARSELAALDAGGSF
jgi:serine/threonine protein kinase/tetratricopeptide (TPR) repeat protein